MGQNCWEMKNCGRQLGGAAVAKAGVCQTSIECVMPRVNDGKNGGRVCWTVAGTMSTGKAKGTCSTLNSTLTSCTNCDVYKRVRQEQGASFTDRRSPSFAVR